MSDSLVVFKTLKESEKQNILQKLLATQEAVSLRNKSDQIFTLKPLSLNLDAGVKLKCHSQENANLSPGAVFIASFILGNEKYMFETQPVGLDGQLILSIDMLFHLQKRRNYRYALPDKYTAKFVIGSRNRMTYLLPCKLLDVSPEGCAAEISLADANLKLEDVIEAKIYLGDNEPIPVQGVIKNIREKDHLYMVLGVQFNHIGNASEGRIITAITELQREVYFRRVS